jgi:pheromone shutdown protein TraB
VVAVVGAAHVPGLVAALAAPLSPAVRAATLDVVPPPSRVRAALRWLLPVLVGAAFVLGWRRGGLDGLAAMARAWILPTAVGGAAATLLAGGSIPSVLTALIGAPLMALHPRRHTGRLVGVVEAWRRRPRQGDLNRAPDELTSLRGFRRNPVTRTLLVAAIAGIGTTLGTVVALGWLALRL